MPSGVSSRLQTTHSLRYAILFCTHEVRDIPTSGSPLLKAFDHWEPLLWKLVDEDGAGLKVLHLDSLDLLLFVNACRSLWNVVL